MMNPNYYKDKQVFADNYDGKKKDVVMQRIPDAGEILMFFDNGIASMSRMYQAFVMKTYKSDELPEFVKKAFQSESIRQIYTKDENGKNVSDVFIECEIPSYDKNNIWFARTTDGGYFSFDVQSGFQGGRLDVDGRLLNYIDSLND